MGMMSEFKEFAMKGNVVDLAIGVIIGTAFGKIVTALVNGVIMPFIGNMIGGVVFGIAAVAAGYRPCGHCLRPKYREWLANQEA